MILIVVNGSFVRNSASGLPKLYRSNIIVPRKKTYLASTLVDVTFFTRPNNEPWSWFGYCDDNFCTIKDDFKIINVFKW